MIDTVSQAFEKSTWFENMRALYADQWKINER